MTKTPVRRRTRDGRWAWMLGATLALVAALSADIAAAKSAQKNAIKSVRVVGSGDSRDVVIETTLEPTFTVFRLSDPMRVVIDVSGGDISKLDGPVTIDDGIVTTVGVQQFNSDGFSIGRLVVGFNHDVSYDVKAEGTSIIVRSGVSGVRIERAVPPPAAPVDLGAQERLDAARRDASTLAEKASAERKAADVAATTARAEHDEAMRLAAEAVKAQKEATAAKADAEQRKKQAAEAAERDRAKANEALATAEARLNQVQAQQRALAVSQVEADRKAARAEQARKDAEQAAALAEAKHKVRVAELEDQIAKAQSEKRQAAAAEAKAQAAKKDADNAQRVAMQAKADADKARRETDTKLEAIATREREAQKQLDAAATAQRELASQKAQLASERDRIEKMKTTLAEREKQLTVRESEPALVSATAERERAAPPASEPARAATTDHAASPRPVASGSPSRPTGGDPEGAAAVGGTRREDDGTRRENVAASPTERERAAPPAREPAQAATTDHAASPRPVASGSPSRPTGGDPDGAAAEGGTRREDDGTRRENVAASPAERERAAAPAREPAQAATTDHAASPRPVASGSPSRPTGGDPDGAAAEGGTRREDDGTRRENVAASPTERERAADPAREPARAATTDHAASPHPVASGSPSRPTGGDPEGAAAVGGTRREDGGTRREDDGTRRENHGTRREHIFHGVSRAGSAVLLALDGAVEFKAERIENPPRLVIDLVDTERKSKKVTYAVDAVNVRRVRMGEHDGMVRAVFDLASSDVDHEITTDTKGIKVVIHKVKPTRNNDERSAVVQAPTSPPPSVRAEVQAPTKVAAKADVPVTATKTTSIAQVRKVDFGQTGTTSRITLALTSDTQARIDDRSKKAWVLELTNAHVDQTLEKSLDTSAYNGVVRLVSTYQASRDPQIVNVVVQLSGAATGRLIRDNGNVVWEITGQNRPSSEPAQVPLADADDTREPEVAALRTPQTAGYASAAAAVARSIPAQSASGRSRRVSLNFKDADIVNVIRLIADVTGENIITSEEVKGKVTVRLRNVPWETALDTILKSKGYDKVRQNNILRIATGAQIQAEREAEVARQKANEQIEEKVIKIITVNYATASEIVGQLKSLLSSRGTVQTDERTNTIIVEDVKSNIDRLVELVRRLDRQTPQVLIEARIVEASTSYSEDLGVQWGGQGQATTDTGNPTGLSFPSDITVSGANESGSSSGVTSPSRYAVNLPASVSTGGAIGLVFGSASGSQLLQLRLSALESKGTGRIISSPRVATLDNRMARISQGVDIPITVTSAAGANTRFVPANLELEVTPHVTNDGSIVMRIVARRNEPDFSQTGASGDPTIQRREAQTEVLVADGDTTVIGGIYTRNTTREYSQVPVLADIPLLGWLFRSRTDRDTKSELLIFISPKIVNRHESIVTSGESVGG